MMDNIGSVYGVLSNFGYSYNTFNKEENRYEKGNVVIYVVPLYFLDYSGNDFYECSIYIDGEFYQNSKSNKELKNILKVLERDRKIDKITK